MSLVWGQHCYTFDLNYLNTISNIFYLLPWRNNEPIEVHCRPLLVNTMETYFITYHYFLHSLHLAQVLVPHVYSSKLLFFYSSVTQFLIAFFSGSLYTTLTAQRHDCDDNITATATCSTWHYRCKRQQREEFLWLWILIWRLVMGLSVT